MADNTVQFVNEAQDIARSVYGTVQGIAETQFNIVQRLAGVQQELLNQAYEAANEQLQLISRVKAPREYAAAQADLVNSHGQRYVNSINKAVEIVAEAWQEYGDRLEHTINMTTSKVRSTAKKAA
ncbi:MAG TPA: phasin family protein [Gammaproteobacteria bacterium]|nr:phasin family protein [Gammaproteobacteria bacterium]